MNIECPSCKITISIEPNNKGEFHHENPYDPSEASLYTLIECPECHGPILSKRERVYEIGAFDFGKAVRLFPSSEFHINNDIPEALRNYLKECIACYEVNAFTAAVLMSRRTIEGFCELKGVKSNNFAQSLLKLKEKAIINEDIYDWANMLRFTGNKAAYN